MATLKSNKKNKQKIKKPKSTMRANRHAHAFILEPNGKVTCECDPFMVFVNGAGEAEKISAWFGDVSQYLRAKNK